jgi:hypothetical protein
MVKPTVEELGVDIEALTWRHSGSGGDGCVELTFVDEWVLMRVAGEPLILVYDKFEFWCLVEGAKNGDFDQDARPR